MAIVNLAIGTGKFWHDAVAERMRHAINLYVDVSIVIPALRVIPFLKDREEQPATASAGPVAAIC